MGSFAWQKMLGSLGLMHLSLSCRHEGLSLGPRTETQSFLSPDVAFRKILSVSHIQVPPDDYLGS